jgi:hypothetical protein
MTRILLVGYKPETDPSEASTTLSCPLWVISGHIPATERCLLYPRKRTFKPSVVVSALCQ